MTDATPRRLPKTFLAVAIVPALAGVVTANLAPSPSGHWTEHLAGAGLKATQLVLVAGVAMLLGRRRLPLSVLAPVAVAFIAMALQAYGDLRVASSIWGTTGDPGFGDGYEAGHDVGSQGDLLALIAGLWFAGALAATRRARPALALLAAAMVVVPPPFLWPAAGILMVMLHALLTGRSLPPGRRPPASGGANLAVHSSAPRPA